ncbi:MAG: TolC family protein [Thermodesulfobacteriota bacterium]
MRAIIIFAASAVLFMGAMASSAASDVLTLEESIDIAVERSFSIRSAEQEIKRKEFEERSAKADFFPKLSTEYVYTRIDESTVDAATYQTLVLDPTGSPTTRQVCPLDPDTYEWRVSAIQPLFTGWRLTALRELASLGVDTASIQKQTAIHDLVLDVKDAYFGILKAEKLETVAVQAVEQLEAHLRVAQAFYDEGTIAKNELLQTEVQMAQAQQDLIRARNSVELSKSYFNKLLRRGLNAEVAVEDILDYRPVSLTLEECLERAELYRTEIRELSLNILSAEKGVKLAKSSYFPSLSLAGIYSRECADPLLEPDPGEDPDSWRLVLSAEWTFWEWGKTRQEVSASKSQVSKAQYFLRELKDSIQLQVKEAYLNLREAEKNIQVARTAVIQAEENFRMNEERYKQQVATSTDVLDAQTLLTQARSNYFNALSEHNLAWARLERTIGTGFKGSEVQRSTKDPKP